MPSRVKMGRRRRRFVKKATSRGQIYGNAAYQLYKDVAFLKNVINVEYKKVDFSGGPTAISSSGTNNNLNAMSQGTDISNRVGRSVKAVSIYLTLSWTINTAATATRCRTMLVWDKEPAGATPSVGTVLAQSSPEGHLNTDLAGNRFIILSSKNVNLSINGDETKTLKIYRRLPRSYHTIFNSGNAGTVGDINTGALFMLNISSEATNTPTISWVSTFVFIDN